MHCTALDQNVGAPWLHFTTDCIDLPSKQKLHFNQLCVPGTDNPGPSMETCNFQSSQVLTDFVNFSDTFCQFAVSGILLNIAGVATSGLQGYFQPRRFHLRDCSVKFSWRLRVASWNVLSVNRGPFFVVAKTLVSKLSNHKVVFLLPVILSMTTSWETFSK